MKQRKHLFTALFASLFLLAAGSALAADTPAEAPKGVTLVDAKKLQELQAQGAPIVDTRKASEFGEGSIKGAISVPYDLEKTAERLEKNDPAVWEKLLRQMKALKPNEVEYRFK